jgi:aminoglycoside phosphotransferase (APT) family kinase protein
MTETFREAVDVDRLSSWLRANVDGVPDGPVAVQLISGGRSNLTFGVGWGDEHVVLRRPPMGQLLPTAHDMQREFTVLSALHGTAVPVPRVLALCTDPGVIGAPFYLMEHVDGVVLRTPEDCGRLDAVQARGLSHDLAQVLAEIHTVPLEESGLSGFGRPEGFLERQIARWTTQWEKSKTREIPGLDEMAHVLRHHVPAPQAPALVHGDYRLDNLMLSPDTLHPNAVLDWEMSTLGDPLTDLGLLMVYWADADDAFQPPSFARQIVAGAGFLSRSELADAYAAASGRDVSDLAFYVVLGYFKIAIILEGIHKRHTLGNTYGEGFDGLGDDVPLLIEAGLAAAREAL